MDQHVSLYETDTIKNSVEEAEGGRDELAKCFQRDCYSKLSEKEPCIMCSLEKSTGTLSKGTASHFEIFCKQ